MATRLAGLLLGRLGDDPALLPPLVGDGALDGLDGDRVVDDVERARSFARRRADAASDLGEVVGRVQVLERTAPVAVIDEVVPIRDLIVHRTTVVAVGNAAIHAAAGLLLDLGLGQRLDELVPVLQALLDGAIAAVVAVDFEEAGDLAHGGVVRALGGEVCQRARNMIYIRQLYIMEVRRAGFEVG